MKEKRSFEFAGRVREYYVDSKTLKSYNPCGHIRRRGWVGCGVCVTYLALFGDVVPDKFLPRKNGYWEGE